MLDFFKKIDFTVRFKLNPTGNCIVVLKFLLLAAIQYGKSKDIYTLLIPLIYKYSRRESNSYLSFRRATFYPLNYESRKE